MTSLLFGACCIYLAFIILRMPEERFEQELNEITRRGHTPPYYRFIRVVVWALAISAVLLPVFRRMEEKNDDSEDMSCQS